MKYLIIFLVLGFKAYAVDISQVCMTEYLTTSFIAETKGDEVVVSFIHHNGAKYMPIFNGVVTPNDLGTLQDKASILADLGENLEFSFPKSTCQKSEDFIFNCFNTKSVKKIGGHNVSAWTVYSSKLQSKSFAGIYDYIETSIGLDIDGETYYLPMRYFSGDCSDNQNFKNEKLKRINKI